MKRIAFFLTILFFSTLSFADEQKDHAPLFPFVVSFNAPENIVNVSGWNHAPAGKNGFIRVENGTFIHDRGRFLIWGTNLFFSAHFPDKEQAEKLAARLARFGYNCVRLHLTESSDVSSATFDPLQLDKLDYLIYQLKQRGIYVNINLRYKFDADKNSDYFHPPSIDLQKKYARNFLTHVNRYTKTVYVAEPAIAMIEIHNENSVVEQWTRSRDAKIMTMPEPYGTELKKQWNDFLKRKYQNDDALGHAWDILRAPFGKEMLYGNLESQKWHAQTNPETICRKREINGVFRFEVEKHGGPSWLPILMSQGHILEAEQAYTFSIKARADKPTELIVGITQSGGDYRNLGFNGRMALTTEWKTFTFTFVPKETSRNARFDMGRFNEGLTYEFCEATLKPGGGAGLPENQSLQEGTIPLINKDGLTMSSESGYVPFSFPQATRDDFCEFLFDGEKKYWQELYRFLKDELNVRQPIGGTQVNFGSETIQSQLDFIAAHAYWDPPEFLGSPGDINNWTVSNRALVNSLDKDILPILGAARPHGKPFTVGEFDAPFPNQYGAEVLPILAAFGRTQNWDGIFHYVYSSDKNTLESKKASGFFDMSGNTVKLVHQPACVALFRRGDISSDNDMYWLPSENLGRKFLIKAANTKLFTGFSSDGEKFNLGDVNLMLGKTRLNWTTISMMSIYGNGFDPNQSQDRPIRILIAATGFIQNSDMTLEHFDGNRITYGNRIGNEPVLCEGIPFSVQFMKAREVRCYSLDESGNRQSAIETEGNLVCLGPEYKTVWYELEVF